MKLMEGIYMVASGDSGISLTDAGDCSVYLVDGGSEYALIDCGLGNDIEKICQNIMQDGLDVRKIKKIFLTHGHGDHSGGAYKLSTRLNAPVYALKETARYVSAADEDALSITEAKKTGMYAPDFSLQPFHVKMLEHGQTVKTGNTELIVWRTDGHCIGHAAYEVKQAGKTVLFSGDCVFYGGKISLQPLWDCDLQAYIRSCSFLETRRPDALFPAHGLFALNRGHLHLQKAMDRFRELGMPGNMV